MTECLGILSTWASWIQPIRTIFFFWLNLTNLNRWVVTKNSGPPKFHVPVEDKLGVEKMGVNASNGDSYPSEGPMLVILVTHGFGWVINSTNQNRSFKSLGTFVIEPRRKILKEKIIAIQCKNLKIIKKIIQLILQTSTISECDDYWTQIINQYTIYFREKLIGFTMRKFLLGYMIRNNKFLLVQNGTKSQKLY